MNQPARVHPVNVLFAGVGGQGTLTAARLLGEAVHRRGEPVVISQLHGMSQRGGSVQATTAIGTADVLPPGHSRTDILVGFELLESVRVADRLDCNSIAICNRWIVVPPSATVAHRPVPAEAELCAELARRGGPVQFIDAMALLREAGARASSINIVMLGSLTALAACPVSSGELLEVIRDSTAPAQWEMNQQLFALGQKSGCADGPRRPA